MTAQVQNRCFYDQIYINLVFFGSTFAQKNLISDLARVKFFFYFNFSKFFTLLCVHLNIYAILYICVFLVFEHQ